MRIGIIGTGHMGSGLARALTRGGHTVILGSRLPATKADLGRDTGATVTGYDEALVGVDAAFLTLPYVEIAPFARAHADALRNLLVIDISNPFDALPDNRRAGAEVTADAIGDGARVVAAFKTTFAATLLKPRTRNGEQRDVQFAGDNADDKRVVAQLIEDAGFRPLDCGPLHNARILDGMVPLMLHLDAVYGTGDYTSSWKFIDRG